jgi:DNA-binding NtrC family response regulator
MPNLELLRRVGHSQFFQPTRRDLILLFLPNRQIRLERLLRREGFTVVAPSEADQAVAVCLANRNRIAAAIIDESFALEVEEWSLARSLKAVCPNTPVVIIAQNLDPERRDLPEAVDCCVSDEEPGEVLELLRRYISAGSRQAG